MIRALAPVDRLDRGDRTLLLYDRSVVELSPLGVALFEAAATGTTLAELTAAIVDVFGAPPEGSAGDLVHRAVTDLVQLSVLTREGEDDR